MTINKTELKVTKDGFNSMPAGGVIEKVIAGLPLEVVNIEDKKYWQNEEDTVVVEVHLGVTAHDAMLATLKLQELGPDEIDAEQILGRTFIRMWWD